MTQFTLYVDFMLSTWNQAFKRDVEYYGTRVIQQNFFVTQQIKVLTLYVFYRLLLLLLFRFVPIVVCGQIKRITMEIEKYRSQNVNHTAKKKENLFIAIFVMKFELHAHVAIQKQSPTEIKNYEQKKVLKIEVLFCSQSYIMRDKLI